ncbi:DUF1189 family protein [Sporosarcina sp. 179-K 3D1 HS]|uniref:DUF1189 family protein n=1 Tax=Sporosarcina sp. 179-K 3D1 HS TaxID=3232169 RepID=UPI0039A304C4
MKLHQIFKAAIHEPKKLAAFRLLPIGKTFQYVFIFIMAFTLISFIRYILSGNSLFENSPDLDEYGKSLGGLLYPIALFLQLVISTLYIFVRISIFAYAGTLLAKFFKRRGDFRFIWRTSAIACTVPLLLTMLFDYFSVSDSYSLITTSVVHLAYLGAALRHYPKI